MDLASLTLHGEDILGRHPEVGEIRLDGSAALPRLLDWARQYETATSRNDTIALLEIGRAMFGWLNGNGWAERWCSIPGPRRLEIRVEDASHPLTSALFDAPWELLADRNGHLAGDSIQCFEPVRRLGKVGTAWPPRHRDLQIQFMAAAPHGQKPLDFEGEEAAILQATASLSINVAVEESGNLGELAKCHTWAGDSEVLHLSCHGDIDAKQGPFLCFEDEEGNTERIDCRIFLSKIPASRFALIFLSACRTAEQGQASARLPAPFARELIRAGVAQVIGWDGSVFDDDASMFAEAFYEQLSLGDNAPQAAAVARQALLRENLNDQKKGRHWHLARLYLGPQGGGQLFDDDLDERRPPECGEQFLDAERKLVPVAGRHEFVGHRRTIQKAVASFRSQRKAVLLHGMGNLGKSSLAYRLATRLPHLKTVVVFGKYDAASILDRLQDSLPPQEHLRSLRNGATRYWTHPQRWLSPSKRCLPRLATKIRCS